MTLQQLRYILTVAKRALLQRQQDSFLSFSQAFLMPSRRLKKRQVLLSFCAAEQGLP